MRGHIVVQTLLLLVSECVLLVWTSPGFTESLPVHHLELEGPESSRMFKIIIWMGYETHVSRTFHTSRENLSAEVFVASHSSRSWFSKA